MNEAQTIPPWLETPLAVFMKQVPALRQQWEQFLLFGPSGPPIGAKVCSLRSGFGSSRGGVVMTVVGHIDEQPTFKQHVYGDPRYPTFDVERPAYIQLENGAGKYLTRRDAWWFDIEVCPK